MWVLPSYQVKFQTDSTSDYIIWQVNTDEALDAFCKILRLNGITDYQVQKYQFDNIKQVAS